MRDALNMNIRSDRATVRRAISAGWHLTEEQVGRYSRALDVALGHAIKKGDPRAITSCVRTMATIVGQVQADEHLDARLAAGKLTDNEVTIRIVRE
jgi:ferritin-like metal-binding protein YciE